MQSQSSAARKESLPAHLSRAQVETFFELGWIVIPALFSFAEIISMRNKFDRLHRRAQALGKSCDYNDSRFVLGQRPNSDEVRVDRVVWCGGCEPALKRVGRDPRLIEPSAQLLGAAELRQLINQAHFKLPGDEVGFPWHQDSTHRRYGTAEWTDVNGYGSYVQTVIAVDEMTEENGPLCFIAESGRDGHVVDPDAVQPTRLMQRLILQPGDVAFFGPYVYHSSTPNRSSAPRRALINGFTLPGANRRDYPGCGSGAPIQLR
jgi:ectoine hydroxylase-related dioxygenase (phytanoyl-CoA dioxygenase family)